MEEQWALAHRLSDEAGFQYKDRYGRWRNEGEKLSLVEEAIDLFLRTHPGMYNTLQPRTRVRSTRRHR